MTFILLCTGLSACRKKDEQPPEIVVLTPSGVPSYQVGEDIPVSARVSDETALTEVAVYLIDEDLRVVHDQVMVDPTENPFSFQLQYPLDDIHLGSGKHYLVIMAQDGENTSKEFVEIQLVGIPKRRTQVWIHTQGGITHLLDSALNPTSTTSDHAQHTGFFIDSYWQNLLRWDPVSHAHLIDLEGGATISQVNSSTPSQPYFTEPSLLRNGQGLILPTVEDRAWWVDLADGDARALVLGQPDRRPENVWADGADLFVETVQLGTGQRQIVKVYGSSLATAGGNPVGFDVLTGMPLTMGQQRVLANSGAGGAAVYSYDPVSGVNYPILPVDSSIMDYCHVDEGIAFVSGQGLYLYRSGTDQLYWLHDATADGGYDHVQVDQTRGTALVSLRGTNQLLELDLQSGLPVGSFVASDVIVDIEVRYNK